MAHKHNWQFVVEVTNEYNDDFGKARFICECGLTKWVKVKNGA